MTDNNTAIPAKPKKNYIDKKAMFDEIIKSREQERATEELAKMFMMLAEKYSHHRLFREYEARYGRAFKEDLISSGLIACIRAWPKFDPERFDNPFAFFTTCLFRAYIGFLKKEYGFINTKNALKVENGLRGDYGYEEMIKDQEARVEDEENAAIEEAEDQTVEEETGGVLPVDSDEETEDHPEPETPDYKVSNPLVENMTMWGNLEDERVETEVEECEIEEALRNAKTLFGV